MLVEIYAYDVFQKDKYKENKKGKPFSIVPNKLGLDKTDTFNLYLQIVSSILKKKHLKMLTECKTYPIVS